MDINVFAAPLSRVKTLWRKWFSKKKRKEKCSWCLRQKYLWSLVSLITCTSVSQNSHLTGVWGHARLYSCSYISKTGEKLVLSENLAFFSAAYISEMCVSLSLNKPTGGRGMFHSGKCSTGHRCKILMQSSRMKTYFLGHKEYTTQRGGLSTFVHKSNGLFSVPTGRLHWCVWASTTPDTACCTSFPAYFKVATMGCFKKKKHGG